METDDTEDLPAELQLASREELDDLLAKPVGMLGYPGHDTVAWPGLGQKAEATFRQGVICRVSDFGNEVNVPSDRLQFVQHSMANWFGFSGSPIFLTEGTVVALNNSGRSLSTGGLTTSLAYGVRVDCLWELMAYHDLLGKLPVAIGRKEVNIERFSQPDANEKLLRNIRKLLASAAQEIYSGHENNAVEHCNRAVKLMPNYAPIFSTRAWAYNQYASWKTAHGTHAAKYYYGLAARDCERALKLNPTVPGYYLDVAHARYHEILQNTPEGYPYVPEVVEIANHILTQEGIHHDVKAQAYGVRALGNGYARFSLSDLEMAVKLNPWHGSNYTSLYRYWDYHGDSVSAQRAKATKERLFAAVADNDEAWKLATNKDSALRDGQKALILAKRACDATGYKWFNALSTLGAAYAETGDYTRAVEYTQKALEVAPDAAQNSVVGVIRQQLKAHLNDQPWREGS
jgi:tetratricopeptide (TPR) repeat protein